MTHGKGEERMIFMKWKMENAIIFELQRHSLFAVGCDWREAEREKYRGLPGVLPRPQGRRISRRVRRTSNNLQYIGIIFFYVKIISKSFFLTPISDSFFQ